MKFQAQLLSLITYILLISLSEAVNPDQSVKKGYKNCLDHLGECTNYSCAEQCPTVGKCFFDCCYNGYCTFSSKCTEVRDTIIMIIFCFLSGFLFIACVFNQMKQQYQQEQQIHKEQQQQNEQFETTNTLFKQSLNEAMRNEQIILMQQQQQIGAPVQEQQQQFFSHSNNQQQPQMTYFINQDPNQYPSYPIYQNYENSQNYEQQQPQQNLYN